jgi:hypothetical protein
MLKASPITPAPPPLPPAPAAAAAASACFPADTRAGALNRAGSSPAVSFRRSASSFTRAAPRTSPTPPPPPPPATETAKEETEPAPPPPPPPARLPGVEAPPPPPPGVVAGVAEPPGEDADEACQAGRGGAGRGMRGV